MKRRSPQKGLRGLKRLKGLKGPALRRQALLLLREKVRLQEDLRISKRDGRNSIRHLRGLLLQVRDLKSFLREIRDHPDAGIHVQGIALRALNNEETGPYVDFLKLRAAFELIDEWRKQYGLDVLFTALRGL